MYGMCHAVSLSRTAELLELLKLKHDIASLLHLIVLVAIYVDDVARCCKNERYLHILYADDILLLAPSVTQLEKLLRKCEEELSYLDINQSINQSIV